MSRYDSLNACSDYNGQQKAARVTLLLTRGEEFSTREVAEMFGISWTGAYNMMNRISASIPLVKDEHRGGKWYIAEYNK